MKFKIRYADQIVGFFSIVSLVVLVILVFALGVKKNWFTRKNIYYTEFESGSGIKAGMDINYKGFSIGKIKDINLQNDKVTVTYYILDTYIDYVKTNSLLEFSSNILGLGTSFVFHPGNGYDIIEAGSEIYRFDSPRGIQIRESGLCDVGKSSDAISGIINKVEPLLDSVTTLLNELNAALKGQGKGELASIIRNVDDMTRNLANLTELLVGNEGAISPILGDKAYSEILQILSDLDVLLGSFGGVGEQANTILANTTPQLDSALGQVDSALSQIEPLLIQLQDVLTGIKNNPLIKNGVPDRSQEGAATPNVRGGEF